MWDLFEMVNVWHEKMNMKKYWFSFWFFFFQNQKNINSKLKPNHYSFDLERILGFWCWYCCDCWCGGERSKCRRWLLTYWRQSGSRGSFTITQRWRCARTFSKVNACVCVRVCCVAYMLMWCDVMWCVLCFVVNGSNIRAWWLIHHYLSMLLSVIMLVWPRPTPAYDRFREIAFPLTVFQVFFFFFFHCHKCASSETLIQAITQILITRYQIGQLCKNFLVFLCVFFLKNISLYKIEKLQWVERLDLMWVAKQRRRLPPSRRSLHRRRPCCCRFCSPHKWRKFWWA